VDELGDSFQQWADDFVHKVPDLLAALLCLVVTVLVARRVRRWTEKGLRRTSAEPHVRLLVAKLAYFGVVTVGAVVALSLGGVNPGVLVGSLGLGAVALGFALQDIVSNFTAGIVLLLEHPFTRGDHIAMGETEGTVEDIRVRATQLRTPDGQRVLVPNKLLFTNVITNASATVHRRLEVLLEVPQGQDPAKARELLPAAAARVGGVFANPAPQVLVEDFDQGAVNLRLWFWVDPRADDLPRVRSEVLEAARTTLAETRS
jgi:small conductance mechanosensitive channel